MGIFRESSTFPCQLSLLKHQLLEDIIYFLFWVSVDVCCPDLCNSGFQTHIWGNKCWTLLGLQGWFNLEVDKHLDIGVFNHKEATVYIVMDYNRLIAFRGLLLDSYTWFQVEQVSLWVKANQEVVSVCVPGALQSKFLEILWIRLQTLVGEEVLLLILE